MARIFTNLPIQQITHEDDAATTAWVAAVVGNGGTVSSSRRLVVDALIVGLKTDGIFTKLDRLWLYAGEDQPSGLTDIVAASLATAVNSPTFTVDVGFTGNGSTMSIDSNFNPTTAPSPKFIQNSACMFVWDVTANVNRSGLFGYTATSDDVCLIDLNAGVLSVARLNGLNFDGNTDSAVAGLFLLNTPDGTSGNSAFDKNGVVAGSPGGSTSAPSNADFESLAHRSFFSGHQLACYGFGGGLTAGDRTNLYDRLRTYMTAVGVP